MKHLLTSILFLFFGATSYAQHFTYISPGAEGKNYYEEIPYETIKGKMFVTVEVNGKKRKFLFDTGAPVQINTDLFNELKLTFTNGAPVTDANEAKGLSKNCVLPQIKLDSVAFNSVPALVIDVDIYKCYHIDGVIGSNIFTKSIVRIDPVKHIIILTDDEKRLPLNKKMRATLLLDGSQGYPFVVVWIKGKNTIMAGFDTGEADMLVMTESDLKKVSKTKAFEVQSVGYGARERGIFGVQKYDSTHRVKFPSVTIGGYVFNNLTTETNKTDFTRMGIKILDFGVVTLDFIHHYFYFEPNTDKIDLDEKRWPLQPIINDNKLIVGNVWQSLAGQVSPGQQIVAIDDAPCLTADLCEWLNSNKPTILSGKETAVLTIKDENGVLKKISIAKQ